MASDTKKVLFGPVVDNNPIALQVLLLTVSLWVVLKLLL